MTTLKEIPKTDLDELRLLARHVGTVEERIDLLRVQAFGTDDQDSSGPRVLLASAGEGTLEMLLSRWLGDDVGEAVQRAGLTPLVVGAEPERVRRKPGLGSWSIFPTEKLSKLGRTIVALTSTGALTGRVVSELSAAGRWDTVVVVTRASQPLAQAEREMVRSLSRVVAVARVLVVTVPGELATPGDLEKVEQYARGRIESSGFASGRCEGVWFWWLDGQARHTQAVSDPAELLTTNPHTAAHGREMIFRQGIAALLEEIEKKAASVAPPPQFKLSEDDFREMDENLSKALTGLRRKAESEFREAVQADDAKLRQYVTDQVHEWSRQSDLTGVWLNYVETVRPGVRAGLFERVRTAVEVLSLDPAKKRTTTTTTTTSHRPPAPASAFRQTAIDSLVKLAVALTCGVSAWGVATALGWSGLLSALLAAVGTVVGLGVGTLVASGVRRWMTAPPGSEKRGPTEVTIEDITEGKIRNFNVFENDVRTWLNQHIRAEQVDIVARCRALARRLGLDN
jgi:hypothetical protein